VRFEDLITEFYLIEYKILQDSLLFPVIYILYLTKLLNQDPILYFGYADDLCLYYIIKILEQNIKLLVIDIRLILEYSNKNKIFFTLEKVEIIYFSWKYRIKLLSIIINEDLMIYLIIISEKEN
jgi:hypothetical protein